MIPAHPIIHSAPASPSHTPSASATTAASPPTNTPASNAADRLLLPARLRRPQPSPYSAHKTSLQSLKGRRVASGTVDAGQSTSEQGEDVLEKELAGFVVEEEELEVEGYQLFAVEKWVVERETLLPTVTVWTGDPADKITVVVLRLADTSTPFTAAIHPFRKQGARPMEIKQGTIMVTSLSTFRSDLNIIQVPGGLFPLVREDLSINITLSRLGCSGRRALTLDAPSPATQDKFLQIYHLVPSQPFSLSVVTLIKLVQSALLIHGCFPLHAPSWRDGLLCDRTVEGVQRWMTDIGEPVFYLEPSGRVLEAEVVAALLSSVTGARARLVALAGSRREAEIIPRDPLATPAAFIRALAAWQRSHHSSNTYAAPSTGPIFLTAPILRALRADGPSPRARRLSDPPALSRALRQKLDEALPLPLAIPGGHHGMVEVETTDLERFARMSVVKGGEGLDSVRWLWTGRARLDIVRQGGPASGELQLPLQVHRPLSPSSSLALDEKTDRDGTAGEEDADSFLGSLSSLGGVGGKILRGPAGGVGRVGRRGHAIVTGWKKDIMEFGRHRKSTDQPDSESLRSPVVAPSSALSQSTSAPTPATTTTLSPSHSLEVPMLVVSTTAGEEEDPYKVAPTPSPLRSAQSSWSNLSDTLPSSSVAPVSAPPSTSRFAFPRATLAAHSSAHIRGHKNHGSLVGGGRKRPRIWGSKSDSGAGDLEDDAGGAEGAVGPGRRRPEARRAATYYTPATGEAGVGMKSVARRHSFTCLEEFRDTRRVVMGRLKTDVDLCWALLELREKEIELRETVYSLQTLVDAQREATTVVQTALRARRAQFESLFARARPFIVDPSIHRMPGDGIEPTLSRVQHATDEVRRLKYTYEVTDDRLREVEGLVWGLMRRVDDRQIRQILMEEEKRNRGVGPDGKKVWIKGGQRVRSRVVDGGMWVWSWWNWARGRGGTAPPPTVVGVEEGAEGMTSGEATPARTPSGDEARTPLLLRTTRL